MGLARNLSKFKPSSDGLVGAEDIAVGAVTADKLGFALSSNALSQSLPLKSGATLTAGRAVNINSSGEVGDYPVVSTLGTLVTSTTNSYFEGYQSVSTDGSRLIEFSVFDTGTARPFQIRGVAVTGTTTTTGSWVNLASGNTFNLTANCYPINETQFLIGYAIGSASTYATVTYYARVATVDSSGAVSLGSAVSWSNTNLYTPFGTGYTFSPLPSGRFGAVVFSYNDTVVPQFVSRTFTVSDTTVTATADTDMSWYSYLQSYTTSNNKLVGYYEDKVWYCNYDGSVTSSYADTNVATNRRGGSDVFGGLLNANYGISLYQTTANNVILRTYSINQTTGVPTVTNDYTFFNSSLTCNYAKIKIINSTDIIVTFRLGTVTYLISVKLNSTGQVIGTGIPTIIDSGANGYYAVSSTSTSGIVRVFANIGSYGNSRNITINTYNTLSWSGVGATSTAQTTSPTTIVVGGVCGGFSGLTPGYKYYVNELTYDGQVTTTVGSYLVGTAISSTEILLG